MKNQIFKSKEFGQIRTCMVNGECYFVGKDVADALGYVNLNKAMIDHVDDEDKLTSRIVMAGQNRQVIIINESGLYSLILAKLISAMTCVERGIPIQRVDNEAIFQGYHLAFPENKAE